MAQKNKAQTKARASKPSASKTAARPSQIKSASVKTSAKKPAAAAASSHAKKPTPVKPAVTPKSSVAAKAPVAKGTEMKKVAVAATAGKKPALKAAAAAPSQAAQAQAPAKAVVAAKATAAVAPAPVAQRPVQATAALAKAAAGHKLTAPVQPPAPPKEVAQKSAAAQQLLAAQKKSVSQRHGFKTNEFIVYPAHGVGRIVGIEEQEIAGMSLELFVITFDKEKLTLRVPTGKLESVGMRKLADEGIVKKAMETLKGRARVKRTMWSRRAQEYVAKINSGDLVAIAEVVRDLYRSEAQPEQSYSERQLYEDALDRMARELAAVEKLDERGAVQRITDVLSKSARGRRIAEGADAEVKAA